MAGTKDWIGHFINFVLSFGGIFALDYYSGIAWPVTLLVCLFAAAMWGRWMYECGQEDAEALRRERE